MQDEPLIKLSVSKTSTYDSCKAKFKYVYVHRLPRKEFSYHTFGKFLHRVLELFHLHYIKGTQLELSESKESYSKVLSRIYKEVLNEAEFLNKLDPESKKEAHEILDKYLRKLIMERNQGVTHEILSVEKNFNVEINDQVRLIGMIDRVQLDNDGIMHVVDYKTTKNKKYLQGDDPLQLLTYAYVLLQEDPSIKKVRGSYMLLRHDFEAITKEFHLDEILSIKDRYANYGESMLNEKEYPANPTGLCRFCEYVNLCPEGSRHINGGFKFGATKW